MGVHHAGLLPLHKGLVEDLFNAGLIKVCFATETLAAGVNMPARTTVISVLSKRTDNGVGPLSVAQLLQMAGRAGRRGKDVQGNVVLMRSRFEVIKERKGEVFVENFGVPFVDPLCLCSLFSHLLPFQCDGRTHRTRARRTDCFCSPSTQSTRTSAAPTAWWPSS